MHLDFRSAFHEDIDWPPDSPPAKVYDVRNTSAKLVILNNDRKAKVSALANSPHIFSTNHLDESNSMINIKMSFHESLLSGSHSHCKLFYGLYIVRRSLTPLS